MKKITSTIYLCLFLAVSISAQDADCSRMTNFGEAEICLPKIDGYQECYLTPIVQQIADATEVPANMVLGYYLNDDIHSKVDSLGLIGFDNFFKIYGTKQIQDYQINAEMLTEMQEAMSGSFFTQNWDLMEKEIDKLSLNAEVGIPTVIKDYKLNENSFTYIMLTKYEVPGAEPYTLAMSVNGLSLNERLVWMAYYLNYQGESTITRLEENSNRIVKAILAKGK